MNINGILICSGYSSRMGAFKPLLKYNGESFCTEIIRKLKLICSKVVVVTGYNSQAIINELENKNILADGKVITTYNPDYDLGMFTSIQAGVKKIYHKGTKTQRNSNKYYLLDDHCPAAILHMVDQPNLPDEFYYEIQNNIDNESDWIQPEFKGRRGHPILLRSNLFNKIINAQQNSTLRTLFKHDEIKRKTYLSAFPQILTDIDTPEDYNKLINNPETV